MKQLSSGTRLLQGAFILGLAAIISKIIGAFQKIPLQNLGGDGVFGIYNTVYPLYMLIITLAAAGLPLAVSKFVAEQQALGQGAESRRIIRISSMLLAGLGFITAIVMYASAPWIATLIGNQHVIPSIRAASLALLCVPLMTGLRGYFQGMQQMLPTAISQVVEQTVRVTVMIVVLLWLIRQETSIETVAAGAMLGSVAGGCAGLAVMLVFVYWHRRKERTEHMVIGEALYASSERVKDTEKTGQLKGALQDGPRYAVSRNKADEKAGKRWRYTMLLRQKPEDKLWILSVPPLNGYAHC